MEGRARAWPSFSGERGERPLGRTGLGSEHFAFAHAFPCTGRCFVYESFARSQGRSCRRRSPRSISSSARPSASSARRSSRRTPTSGRETSCSRTGSSSAPASSGILGAHYPEEDGGAGGDYWFSVAKAEELPRCLMAGVSMGLLVQSDMATPVINDLGTRSRSTSSSTPALRGDKIAALGVSEPNAGSDVAGIETVARRDGDDYVINGSKTFITNGTRADFVTLLVKTRPEAGAHGCSFFLVPTKTKGFHVAKKLKKIGNHSSDTAELSLRGHARPEALPARRREHGVHVPHAELPERAHHRLRERDRRRAAT